MGKKLFFLVLFFNLALAPTMFAQTEAAKVVNFNDLPSTKFPCITSVIEGSVLTSPYDLSWYCSNKAEKNLTAFTYLESVGFGLLVGGGAAIGVAQSTSSKRIDDDAWVLAGCIVGAAGLVCQVVGVFDLIYHFKWDYRKKQVDFYLSPSSATLRF